MSLLGAGVAAEGADTVAWPAGPETSGPVDSRGGCWEMGEPGLRVGSWHRRLGKEKAGS